jgi:malate dehydrogenase (oxaloacetate-decarboxylating)
MKIAPTFGGINLEDIAAPGAFEIEERSTKRSTSRCSTTTSTAPPIVTLAALDNALKIVGKVHGDIKVVVAGVGAAGVAVSKILMDAGFAT